MKYADTENLGPDDFYFEEIHPNVWLMDDHRWAYYIWEKSLQQDRGKKPRTLVHLDYHWDGVNDFQSATDQNRLLRTSELDEIYRMVSEGIRLRKDSFIAPAIIRGLIEEVHFLCFQCDTTPGIDPELLDLYGLKQFFHPDLSSLLKYAPQGSLFDIDLDIFNRSGHWAEGDLWTDIEISQFLDGCIPLLESSVLVTIAMSFNYSGSADDTRYLSRLVVPTIVDVFRRKPTITTTSSRTGFSVGASEPAS
jgi:hypothetical protein